MSVLKAKNPRMDCRTKLYPSVKLQSTSLVDWLLQLTFPPSIAIASHAFNFGMCPDWKVFPQVRYLELPLFGDAMAGDGGEPSLLHPQLVQLHWRFLS